MTLDGSYTFNAPRERVWALLMDTDAIAGCVPGCEGLEPIGNETRALVTGLEDEKLYWAERLPD